MGRKRINGYVADEAGNIVGGTSHNIRVYELDVNNKSTDILATLYLAQSGVAQITNDGTFHPYSGQETAIRVQPAVGDVLIQVTSTTGLQVGDVIRFFSGATIKQRTIKVITDADTLELTEAIGFAFPVGSVVGSEGGTGYWEAWVEDDKDYEWTVENDATGEEGERQPLYVKVPDASMALEEEGVEVLSASRMNFVGTGLTVTNAGAGEGTVTHGDLSAHGGALGSEAQLGTAEDLVKKWALIG